MAMARLNLPSVMLYGGSIMYGEYKGKRITVQDIFEAIGACNAGKIDAKELHDDREPRLPGRGRLRRPVHRQHDGHGVRDARCLADGLQRRAGVGSAQGRDRVRDGPAGRWTSCARALLPRQIITKKSLLQLDRRRHGHRRLDQRGAAPPRGGQGGRRQADDRRVRPDLAQDAAARRHEAVGQLTRRRRCTRPAAWVSSPSGCSTPACSIDERDDGHRPHDRRGGAGRARDAGPEGRPRARTIRSSRRAASSSCAATSRPTAAWPRSPARSGTSTAGPRASSIARRTPSRR